MRIGAETSRLRRHRQRAPRQGWVAAHFANRRRACEGGGRHREEGQQVRVKVLEADENGRLRLSIKKAAAEESLQHAG